MRVWLNGEERGDMSALGSPQEVLEAVRMTAAASGCAVTSIQAGGAEIDADVFTGISMRHDVFFTLRPVRELMDETIESAEEYAPRLRRVLENIAAVLASGIEKDTAAPLMHAVEGLEWLLGVYERCSLLTGAPMVIEEETAMRTELLTALGGFVAGAVNGDAATMSAVLRERIIPFVTQIENRLKCLPECGTALR